MAESHYELIEKVQAQVIGPIHVELPQDLHHLSENSFDNI